LLLNPQFKLADVRHSGNLRNALPVYPEAAENPAMTKEPDAVHYRSVAVDGVDIFYREAGNSGNATILLLHGFPTSSHMFRDLIPLLSDRYHLIAPDYPGYGYSDAPPVDKFTYSFDHLTDIIARFIDVIGLTRFALYMQDFGGPIGFRLASRYPKKVTALIVQNANAYDEGVTEGLKNVVLRAWTDHSEEASAQLRTLFELPVTKRQFLEGAPDPSLVSPDGWTHAQWGMDRPGNKDIQFALHANYGSNPERYDEWHAYFRQHQPPTLVVWGRGDFVFAEAGAQAYAKDLPDAEIHLIDAGHFALETNAQQIADYMRGFLAKLPTGTR
jgi:pimeloyl-ACP methyl ester carboxylesterase